MNYIAQNPDLANAMEKNATKISETFSEKNISAKWLELFDEIK